MKELSYYLNNISALTYAVIYFGGVLTSFTPCVYPLIPMIVSVVGGTSDKSKTKSFLISLTYVLGMALTFSILGLMAALGGKMFGQVQSSPITNLVVGNVMILFGLSLLGVIPLPTFILNRIGAGKIVKGGNFLSVFLMGVVSGLVAAPCAAAVLGALLTYVATTQNSILGFSFLFTFAIGLGTLLVIAGTFTGILVTLSKSGKVMSVIQKLMALLMILLGEYYVYKAGTLSI